MCVNNSLVWETDSISGGREEWSERSNMVRQHEIVQTGRHVAASEPVELRRPFAVC
jgi:hypothetical protein